MCFIHWKSNWLLKSLGTFYVEILDWKHTKYCLFQYWSRSIFPSSWKVPKKSDVFEENFVQHCGPFIVHEYINMQNCRIWMKINRRDSRASTSRGKNNRLVWFVACEIIGPYFFKKWCRWKRDRYRAVITDYLISEDKVRKVSDICNFRRWRHFPHNMYINQWIYWEYTSSSKC